MLWDLGHWEESSDEFIAVKETPLSGSAALQQDLGCNSKLPLNGTARTQADETIPTGTILPNLSDDRDPENSSSHSDARIRRRKSPKSRRVQEGRIEEGRHRGEIPIHTVIAEVPP